MEFEPITLEGLDAYQAKLSQTPSAVSDYSFVNIWGWAREYDLEWAFAHDLVWIRQNTPQRVYWAPVGPWSTVDWPAVLPRLEPQAIFTRVPEPLAQLWQ